MKARATCASSSSGARTSTGIPTASLALAREAAHAVRRVLHARDATGREIARVLGERLRREANLTVIDHALAVSLIVEGGRVAGVRFIDEQGQWVDARARATLVATGGAGRVYSDTTNPAVATGDGIALGYLAGADVADLEFVQFHPTVLDVAGRAAVAAVGGAPRRGRAGS